jgi:hypothetical protein
MRSGVLVGFWLLVLGQPTVANEGSGEFAHHDDVPFAVHAKPLEQIGDDVIRFSTTPALGGPAWVAELHREPDRGVGSVTFGYWGRGDWEEGGSLSLGLSLKQYDELVAKVDALVAQSGAKADTKTNRHGIGVVHICTDGPGYLTERRKNGRTIWLDGFCGDDHPNNAIARLMFAVVSSNLCSYGPSPDLCAKN